MGVSKRKPPAAAVKFFRWYCNDHFREALLGDMTELYERRLTQMKGWKADVLFIWNVITFFRPFALKRTNRHKQNNLDMFENYVKIAWRTMTRQKIYAAIKIGGFAIGLATCILIFLFIRNELSYDRQYGERENVFRIYNDFQGPDAGKWTSFPASMASILKNELPEVEKSGRIIPYKWFNAGNNLFRRDDQQENTYEEGFIYADQEALDILEIPFIYGDASAALAKPYTIVITKKIADKYFPSQDPVGKVVILNDDKTKPYSIGGVIKDFGANSHLDYDFIITLKDVEFWQGEQASWCCWNYNVYIQLRSDANPKAFENKMLSVRKHLDDYLQTTGDQSLADVKKYHKFKLQRISDIYLHSDGIEDAIKHGDMRYVWLFGGIAVFILILACINFINLSTAKSANRAKEVGMRKVMGSARVFLIRQFLTESFAYSLLSFAVALVLVFFAMPYFNALAGKTLIIPWLSLWFIPSLIAGALAIGIIAGLYPAFYLSGFRPAAVLKGSVSRGSKSSRMRSGMVIFQFTTSIVLIIGTLIIQRQMNFILNTKLGFDKEQVLMIEGANTLKAQQIPFKNELNNIAGVEGVTITNYLPVSGTNRDQNMFWKEGRSKIDKGIGAQRWYIDEDYIRTMGMKLVEGRSFDPRIASDSQAIIINQTMARKLGLQKPILGQRIMNWTSYTIIGVVEDFNFESMRDEIGSLSFSFGKGGSVMSVKINEKNTAKVVEATHALWDKFMPNQPFRYTFLDESYAKMYEDVKRTGTIFASFAGLAIVVACLGLFALSAFMVEQRSKEISIRLVMGASVKSIFGLLTKGFVILVLISFAIAGPLAYFMMVRWLEDYKYKTPLTIDLFLTSGVLALGVALMTIGYQSLRAALANPATSLRSE